MTREQRDRRPVVGSGGLGNMIHLDGGSRPAPNHRRITRTRLNRTAMAEGDAELLRRFMDYADREHGDHVTVLKFSTNWRVVIGTPTADDADDCYRSLPSGATLAEAIAAAIRAAQRQQREYEAECEPRRNLTPPPAGGDAA